MGLTYGEIGRRVDCAEAMARSRVHRALCMIRSASAETWKPAVPVCSGMGMNRILDYAYDLLRPESMEAVEKHLRDCSSCRDLVGAARVLMCTVDASAIDRRTMRLLDFDDRGVPGLYAALAKVVSEEDAPCDSISFTRPPDCVRGVAIPGARLSCDMLPAHDHSDRARYTAYLPRAVSPGQVLHSLFTHGPRHSRRAVWTDRGTYRMDWDAVPPAHAECSYSQMIRQPKGSRLVASSPIPAETIVNGSTTLIRSSLLKSSEGFRTSIEYRLDP